MTDPVLLVIDDNPDDLAAFERLLRTRYGASYRVIADGSPEAGLRLLEQMAQRGDEVALVAADLRMSSMDGIQFLERAHAIHPCAMRALLVDMDQRRTRIPFSALGSLQRATALGRLDLWIVKGWSAAEELVYPHVQEALSAWTRANRPRHEVVRLVGERWSPRCHELRDLLGRNTVPFGFYDSDSDEGQRLLREYGVDTERLPAVILHDGSVLHDPTLIDLANALGVQTQPAADVYDLAILGAGPAGLAAAVYGASEGLRTVVIEPQAIGGQAGTSSMIRNYLGFPRGVSGGELTFRAWEQTLLFGAEFVFMQRAVAVTASGDERLLLLGDGSEVRTRAVIIAAGVAYRRLEIPALERLVGLGVFYGAAGVEAPALAGEAVYVVGGANSAGQAALHLAKYAAQVTLLVRGGSLEDGMSDYLITQITATPNIAVRLRTRVVNGGGAERLEHLTLEDGQTGQQEGVAAAGLFILIGAEPRTEWLREAIVCDDRGFLLTGRDVPTEAWLLPRAPLPFETSMPGVFAVGDVRHGSVKRVAGAVGEGSVAIGSIHQYLSL
jgi:thioredoxin reductase (NADPH)